MLGVTFWTLRTFFYWTDSSSTFSIYVILTCDDRKYLARLGNSIDVSKSSIEVSYTRYSISWWFENIRSRDKYVHVVKIIWQVAAHTRTPNKTTRYIRVFFFFFSFRYLWIVGVCFFRGTFILFYWWESSMLKELTTLFIDLSLLFFFFFCSPWSKKGVINNHRIEPARNCASISDSTQTVLWSFDRTSTMKKRNFVVHIKLRHFNVFTLNYRCRLFLGSIRNSVECRRR